MPGVRLTFWDLEFAIVQLALERWVLYPVQRRDHGDPQGATAELVKQLIKHIGQLDKSFSNQKGCAFEKGPSEDFFVQRCGRFDASVWIAAPSF